MTKSTTIISRSEYAQLPTEVRHEAEDLYEKLHKIQANIDSSNEKAAKAKNLGGLFKGRDRDNLLADANALHSEAMRELADIQQATIALTCTTIEHASEMVHALSYIAVCGIDGLGQHIEAVGDQAANAMDAILNQAENFIYQQKSIQSEQIEIVDRIEKNNEEIELSKAAIEKAENDISDAKSGLQKVFTRIRSIGSALDYNGRKIEAVDKRLSASTGRINEIDKLIVSLRGNADWLLNEINGVSEKLDNYISEAKIEIESLDSLLLQTNKKRITFSQITPVTKLIIFAPTCASIILFILSLVFR